ncbi:MAG: hypothetical protein WAU45_15195 [Blastocatellia bacterium]
MRRYANLNPASATMSLDPNLTPRLILIALMMLAVSSCNRVLLDERFHDERIANWTVVDDPDTVERPSEWKVEKDGDLHQRSNIWGRRGDFIGRWYGTFLIAGDRGWSDYTFQLKTKPADDDGFGVVFRWTDAEHFYRLIFVQDGLNGGPITRLDKRDGADYTELWSAPRGYRPGTEMTVEVEVNAEMLAARVDGRELFRVKDGSYRRGKIGLFCYAQNGQAFDEVKVVGR